MGRDGQASVAKLLLVKGIRQVMDASMKQYVTNNDVCRRCMLFSHFVGDIVNAEPLACAVMFVVTPVHVDCVMSSIFSLYELFTI